MKFLLAGGNWHSEWQQVKTTVPEADNLGYWGFVVPDHYMWTDKQGNKTLDAWTILSFLAARTQDIRLGTLVTPIPLRPPAQLAKTVTTLDILSNGRAILGVGAGWLQTEFEAYSTWDPAKTRVDKTEEAVHLILQLWTRPTTTFHGQHYQTKNAVLEPKPVQQPHPPLLFGGERPRMLRLAGKHANICFIPPWIDFEEAKQTAIESAKRWKRQHKLAFAAGAPSAQPPYLGPSYIPDTYSKRVEEAREAGCNYFIVPFPRKTYTASMKHFARNILSSFSD